MNYQKIYNSMMEKFRGLQLSTGHKHHIKPASMCKYSYRYGEQKSYIWDYHADIPENIITLTPKAHYIAHLLLAKIHGGKMWFAFNQMKKVGRTGAMYTKASQHIANIQKYKWKSGTHNLIGMNKKRIDNETHNFGKDFSARIQKRLIKEETHHFLTSNGGSKMATERNRKMIAEGKHISVNTEAKEKFKRTRNERILSGNWHTCGVKPWNNNSTKEKSKEIYHKMDMLYELWLIHKCGSKKLATLCRDEWSQTHQKIIDMFKDGFIPLEDGEWLEFRSQYQHNTRPH